MVGVDPQTRRSIARNGGWGVCFAVIEFSGMGMDLEPSCDET